MHDILLLARFICFATLIRAAHSETAGSFLCYIIRLRDEGCTTGVHPVLFRKCLQFLIKYLFGYSHRSTDSFNSCLFILTQKGGEVRIHPEEIQDSLLRL